MPAGRPTKYKEKYCKEIIDFFSRKPYRKEIKSTSKAYGKSGNETFEKIEYMFFPNDPPFLYQFADKIGVNTDTIVEWADRYPEFTAAYTRAKELFKTFLITNGLNRTADSAFTIFTAKNTTDMKDKLEIEPSDSFIEAVRQAKLIRESREKALLQSGQ